VKGHPLALFNHTFFSHFSVPFLRRLEQRVEVVEKKLEELPEGAMYVLQQTSGTALAEILRGAAPSESVGE
jgi:hypothetical protein